MEQNKSAHNARICEKVGVVSGIASLAAYLIYKLVTDNGHTEWGIVGLVAMVLPFVTGFVAFVVAMLVLTMIGDE